MRDKMSYKQRSITCPKCGYQFDILYARAISCQGCQRLSSNLSCDMVRCPNCDYEFPVPRSATRAVEALRRWRPNRVDYTF
ncbi:hypothetical protein DRO22_02880 [Candidatus Bathyarchaeota archaeon]|nr:MAG: hypothetical protein DRO22_02880 [Candidatus Bathyarchaeota archaeon]